MNNQSLEVKSKNPVAAGITNTIGFLIFLFGLIQFFFMEFKHPWIILICCIFFVGFLGNAANNFHGEEYVKAREAAQAKAKEEAEAARKASETDEQRKAREAAEEARRAREDEARRAREEREEARRAREDEVRRAREEREAALKAEKEAKQNFVERIQQRTSVHVLRVTVVGGTGWENDIERRFVLTADEKNIYLSDDKLQEKVIPLTKLVNVEISGPGTVTSGGGFGGGGFGLGGFIVGAVAAGALNALTTRTNTETVVFLQFTDSEIILLNTEVNLDAMRIHLSYLFQSIQRNKNLNSPNIAKQLEQLSELRKQGALTEEEYTNAKAKVIAKT